VYSSKAFFFSSKSRRGGVGSFSEAIRRGHEGFEWWLMTRGMDYFPAHWDAEGYEHYLLKLDGVSQEGIDAYEEECQEYVSADEAARITPECVPPDLYLGPYERDEDALDKRILPILRQAQVLSMGILSMSMGV
jgi:hypothetical protein